MAAIEHSIGVAGPPPCVDRDARCPGLAPTARSVARDTRSSCAALDARDQRLADAGALREIPLAPASTDPHLANDPSDASIVHRPAWMPSTLTGGYPAAGTCRSQSQISRSSLGAGGIGIYRRARTDVTDWIIRQGPSVPSYSGRIVGQSEPLRASAWPRYSRRAVALHEIAAPMEPRGGRGSQGAYPPAATARAQPSRTRSPTAVPDASIVPTGSSSTPCAPRTSGTSPVHARRSRWTDTTGRTARHRPIGPPDEDGVDREAHEHHVDPVRVGQPQAGAGLQRRTAHQAHELGPQRAGDLQRRSPGPCRG